MRRVILDRAGPAPDLGPEVALRMKKLTRHLWARLMELEEDGLQMLSPTDPQAIDRWTVWVNFPGRDNREMVRHLRTKWRVLCRCDTYCPQGRPPLEAVRFDLGPENSFEEMDYVQDAVYQRLLKR